MEKSWRINVEKEGVPCLRNVLATGAPPWTPLGKLKRSQPPSQISGEGGNRKGREWIKKEGWEEEGKGRRVREGEGRTMKGRGGMEGERERRSHPPSP